MELQAFFGAWSWGWRTRAITITLPIAVGCKCQVALKCVRGAVRLELEQPILRSPELEALKRLDFRGWRSAVIDATWPAAEGAAGLAAALARMCEQATAAIESGAALLILSDRAAGVWLLKQLQLSRTRPAL